MINCGIHKTFPKQIKTFENHPEVMQNLSSVINNLGYKNKNNKQWAGENGQIDHLIKIYTKYIKKEHFQSIVVE